MAAAAAQSQTKAPGFVSSIVSSWLMSSTLSIMMAPLFSICTSPLLESLVEAILAWAGRAAVEG